MAHSIGYPVAIRSGSGSGGSFESGVVNLESGGWSLESELGGPVTKTLVKAEFSASVTEDRSLELEPAKSCSGDWSCRG